MSSPAQSFEQVNRAFRVAGLRQIDSELHADIAVRDAVLERRFERADCLCRAPFLPVDECEIAIRVRGVGPSRDDLLEQLRGFLGLAPLVGIAGAVEQLRRSRSTASDRRLRRSGRAAQPGCRRRSRARASARALPTFPRQAARAARC